jgi:hypothetical protein
MQGGVHYIAMSHVHHCLNSMLSPSILMLCSNARKGLRLPFIHTLLAVFLSRENSIIAMVVFDFGTCHIPKPLLKTSLSHHHLIGTKRNLIFNPNETRCSIIIIHSPLKTPFFCLTAITLKQSTRSFANELISGNKITNFISVTAEGSLIFRDNRTAFHVGSRLPGTIKEARLTYWNDTVPSRRDFWFDDWWQNRAFSLWFFKRPLTHEFLDPIHVDTKLPLPQ